MADEYTKEALQQEFKAWEIWEGMLGSWHARVKGATPPIMVWGEDLTDLRDQIKAKTVRMKIYLEMQGRNSIA